MIISAARHREADVVFSIPFKQVAMGSSGSRSLLWMSVCSLRPEPDADPVVFFPRFPRNGRDRVRGGRYRRAISLTADHAIRHQTARTVFAEQAGHTVPCLKNSFRNWA